MPSPSADLEWLMHLFSGYYPSSHGPERSLLLGPLTCGQESFPFCHFYFSGRFCFFYLEGSPDHKVIQGVRIRNPLLLPPSVYYGCRACAGMADLCK